MVHRYQDDGGGQEGKEQPQIILVVEGAHQHEDQDAAEHQAGPRGQDINGPGQNPGLTARRERTDTDMGGKEGEQPFPQPHRTGT
jgi:hypothetical protein